MNMNTYTKMPDESILNKGLSEKQLFEFLYNAALFNNKIIYIGRLLQRAAFLTPAATALIYKDQLISYKDLYERAVVLSKLLKERGAQKGDRILLFWENSIEFYIAYFAILQVGAVVAPLNVFLTSAEVMHIISDAKPCLMIVSDELLSRLAEVDHSLFPPLIKQADFPPHGNSQEGEAFEIVDLEPDEMAALLYTSGTTGFPKGVMISSKNAVTNVMQGLARLKLGLVPGERLFCILPLFHSFAQFVCVWGAFFTSSTVIVIPRIERRYLLEGLKKNPTVFLGVPALYGLLILLKNAPLDSIKYFVSGGDALQDRICAGFELIYRRKICSGYGLTETSPLIAIHLKDEAVRSNTVGELVSGIEAEIRDDQGKVLPKDSIGELWVKGDNIMLGYYNAPEATDAVLKNGWFNTGDMAYFDAQDRLVITGRLKDVIASKGIKVYPQEIENVIAGHSLVLRVGVVGREDKVAGQVPVAYVQVRHMAPDIEYELQELCRKNLAPYKIPRSFILTTEALPVTATGKVDKKKLK